MPDFALEPEVVLRRDGRQLIVEAPGRTLSFIRDKLSVKDPSARYVLQRYPSSTWDGRVHFLTEKGGRCGLGLKARIIKILKADGAPYRDEASTDINIPFGQHLSGVTLVPDQIAASEALLKTDTGCIELDVSSGKSYILMNLAACALKQNPDWKVVILVPKKALLYQFFKDAQKVLPQLKIGILGDGHRQLHQVTIATVATAVAKGHIKDSKVIQDWMDGADVIITDEAHHATASTWEAIYTQSTARIMWGVSAKMTFSASKRILERGLEAAFGPPLYKGSVAEFRVPVRVTFYHFNDWDGRVAHVSSRLMDGVPAVYLFKGAWHRGVYHGLDEDGKPSELCLDEQTGRVDPSKYGIYTAAGAQVTGLDPEEVIYGTAHDSGIMEFKDRDTWAMTLAQRCTAAREIFLISVSRDRHGKKLIKRLTAAGVRVSLISGKITTGESNRVMEAWKAKEIDGVVAHHSCVSEGLSIPSLWHFIKLDGQAGDMVLHQQIGRPARVEEGKKEGRMHIPADTQHPTLLKNTKAMAAYYKRHGKTIDSKHYKSIAEFEQEG